MPGRGERLGARKGGARESGSAWERGEDLGGGSGAWQREVGGVEGRSGVQGSWGDGIRGGSARERRPGWSWPRRSREKYEHGTEVHLRCPCISVGVGVGGKPSGDLFGRPGGLGRGRKPED